MWQIIGVCDRNFGIESGYGGITGIDNQTDTSLIMALAQSPELIPSHLSFGYPRQEG
ncbi:hypothetical protein [Nostoc sp.]|uniref:hypothetical protein n=1 Tax=Nostoc sp. TaxID=1180 RepID=UPI002FFBE1D3